MTKRITEIDRRGDDFHSIAKEIAAEIYDAFALKAYPIPSWFDDVSMSVAIAALEELIERGIEIEDRK